MLIAMGMYAFKYSVFEVRKQRTLIPQKAINFNFMRTSINSAYFYVIEKHDKFKTKERPDMYYLFDGRSEELYFVSSSPLFSKTIVLARFYKEGDKLLYQESPVYDFRQDFKNPFIFDDAKSYTIIDGIEEMKFSYFKDKKRKGSINGDMPRMVELDFRIKKKEYTYYFAINSNFYDHKKLLGNEKYPF